MKLISDEEIKAVRNPMNSPANKGTYGLHDVCRAVAQAQLDADQLEIEECNRHMAELIQAERERIVQEIEATGGWLMTDGAQRISMSWDEWQSLKSRILRGEI